MSTYLDFKCAECGATATLLGTDAGVLACDAHRETIAPHVVTLTGWDRDLWGHQLEVIQETDLVQLYRLTDPQWPGAEAQSVRIAFLPHHVVVHGDLCPGPERHTNRGVISEGAGGRGWFVGATSGAYLCSKFLGEVWVAAAAVAKCRALIEEHSGVGAQDRDAWALHSALEQLASDAEGLDESNPGDVAEWTARLYDLTEDSEDLEACQDYEPGNAALLCAIQRRFRFLWLARAT